MARGISWRDLAAHPAWHGNFRGGQSRYGLPNTESLDCVVLSEETRSEVAERFGIVTNGPLGKNNRIYMRPDMPRIEVQLDFQADTSDNCLLFLHEFADGASFRHRSEIVINASANLAIFNAGWLNFRLQMHRLRNAFYIGRETSTEGNVNFVVSGESSIQVGDDCMFAWNVLVRSSDMHAIIDFDNRAVLNAPKDVCIGPHCWIAHDTLILKGANIGQGCIVGSGSTMGRSAAPRTAWAGNPAKCVREGVTWSRFPLPDERQIEHALRAAGKGE